MRKFLSTIFVIIFTMPVLAATVPMDDCDKATSKKDCPAGCKWSGLSCKICTDNSYSTTAASTDCTKCPDAYPYATDGATSASECYVECPDKNLIDNTGTIAPDSNRAYNPPTTPPRFTTCLYRIPENITCNEGYHLTTATIGNGDLSNTANLCISNTLACKDTGELAGCPDNKIVGDATWSVDNGK